MKSLFAITFLAITLSVFSLACNKFYQANSSTGPTNLNSTQVDANAPANTSQGNVGAASSTAPDKAQVLDDLVAVEREYLKANTQGDKATLEHLLADDFSARSGNQLHDKVTWIGEAPGFPHVASNNIFNPELVSYTGDTATVHLSVRTTFNDKNSPVTEMDSISYMKKDGRWQIESIIAGR
jgi:hypothetical protein